MAPNGEMVLGSSSRSDNPRNKLTRLSVEGLQRTLSDISLELSKEDIDNDINLPPISELENAKCECCDMCEECTPEYISQIRDKFSGKLICGLCAEAVKEEMEKKGWKIEEAVNEHMSACVRFNRFGRTHPVLYQAEAMREMLKRSSSMEGRASRAKSMSPREKKGGIARSSSCIPAITREFSILNFESGCDAILPRDEGILKVPI